MHGSHGIYVKFCKHSVFLNNFRYPDYARPTLHCSIDNHIVSWLLLAEIWFIFPFCWFNVVIKKVYVAFNDLHNLKICESKMGFKIDVWNILRKINLLSNLPPSLFSGTTFSPKFWNEIRKNECLGGLKSLFHRYFPGGLLCFLSKKTVKENIALRTQFWS